jgi:tyrosyl-tRNA synthetase
VSSTETLAQLARNAVHLLPENGLAEKLRLGRPLRVKLGIDVTSPDIHIGRAIPLQRMRAFQDAGHVGVLIIGDYTTRIGDPSGRSAERPILDTGQIDRDAQTYIDQAMVILDPERTEIRFNWLAACAFHAARGTDYPGLAAAARRAAEAADPLLREEARAWLARTAGAPA